MASVDQLEETAGDFISKEELWELGVTCDGQVKLHVRLPSCSSIRDLRLLVATKLLELEAQNEGKSRKAWNLEAPEILKASRELLLDFHEGLVDLTLEQAGLRNNSKVATDPSQLAAAFQKKASTIESEGASDPRAVAVAEAAESVGPSAAPLSEPASSLAAGFPASNPASSPSAQAAPHLSSTSTSTSTSSPAMSLAVRKAIADASEILDWLFVGGSLVATNAAALKSLDIGFVLNCCERIAFASKRTENKLLKMLDIKGESLSLYVDEATTFMQRSKDSGKRCLVHCMVGASRSVSLVLAYMVRAEQWPLKTAWLHVKSRRIQARPNRSFVEQLIELEFVTTGERTAALSDFGW